MKKQQWFKRLPIVLGLSLFAINLAVVSPKVQASEQKKQSVVATKERINRQFGDEQYAKKFIGLFLVTAIGMVVLQRVEERHGV